jgi:predicted nucleic acid-binding protein
MTLYLDATALLARHLYISERTVVLLACAADTAWCASTVALGEALSLADRVSDEPDGGAGVRRALRADWEKVCAVPVDRPCLERAAELTAAHPLRLIDAIHLAAADRLPPPVTYVTFDDHQIPVALALGFDVVSS